MERPCFSGMLPPMREVGWALALVWFAACGGEDSKCRPSLGLGVCDGQPQDGAPDASASPAEAGGPSACVAPEEQKLAVGAATHVRTTIDYADPPPVGGQHHECWLRSGTYTSELPDERWVHNLEHGAVVYLYNCPAGCPEELAALTAFVSGRAEVILTPYAALPTRFGAVAWEYRLLSDCYDARAFEGFYTAHLNKGAPEDEVDAEPSPACL